MDRLFFLLLLLFLVQAGASSKAVAKPGPRDDAELDDEVPFISCQIFFGTNSKNVLPTGHSASESNAIFAWDGPCSQK